MTNIDITKSQFLLRDLQNIQAAMLKLNGVDSQIQKVIDDIGIFTQNPTNVDGVELKLIINVARDISKSYEKDAKNLTSVLNGVLEEIDHLILSKRLTSNADLIRRINVFYKLALGK